MYTPVAPPPTCTKFSFPSSNSPQTCPEPAQIDRPQGPTYKRISPAPRAPPIRPFKDLYWPTSRRKPNCVGAVFRWTCSTTYQWHQPCTPSIRFHITIALYTFSLKTPSNHLIHHPTRQTCILTASIQIPELLELIFDACITCRARSLYKTGIDRRISPTRFDFHLTRCDSASIITKCTCPYLRHQSRSRFFTRRTFPSAGSVFQRILRNFN